MLPSASFTTVLRSDEIRIAQADFLAGREAVVLGRRNLAEIILLDVDFAGEGHLARSGGRVFGVVGDLDELLLPGGVVIDDELEGIEHSHGAAGAAVQVIALKVLEHFDIDDAIGARYAGLGDEDADGLGSEAAAAHAGESGHTRVVPSGDAILPDQLDQQTFAEQGVGDVEAVEFDLPGGEDAKLLDEPAIERLVIGVLEGAHGVGDALDGVGLAVRVVVHGVDAPLVAGAVVGDVENAVHDGVAHVEVGRGHVDFGAEDAGAVGEFASLHASEEVEIFFDGTVAVGRIFSGLGEGAAVLTDFVGGEVVDVGFAGLDEFDGPGVELGEVVGGEAEALPVEAEPVDVVCLGVDVLLLFFYGVGVIEAQVGFAAELVGEAEVEADGLGVADVKVAVGLRRKARLDDGVAEFFGANVFGDEVVEKIGRTDFWIFHL